MKKKILILCSILSLMLCIGVGVYAYFIKTLESNSFDLSSSLSSNSTEISSLTDFYSMISQYDETSESFNSSQTVSTTTKRTTLKLMTDLVLTADAVITRDCNLDLNGHTIELNSYQFIVKNQYDGKISVYNGAISDINSNKVLVDCPNAHVVFYNIIWTNVESMIISEDADEVLNSAMTLVYSNLANHGVNDFYSTQSALNDFGNPSICTFEDHTQTDTSCVGCIYTYSNLDLIYTYYSYKNVKITYQSSDESIVSSSGRVNDETTQTVVLTVSITYSDVTSDKVLSNDIYVHVVHEQEYEQASVNTLLQKLYSQYYYQSTDLSDTNNNKYVFSSSFMLPRVDEYFGTYYIYELSNGLTSSTESDYFEYINDNYVVLHLDSGIDTLGITSKLTSESSGYTLPEAIPVSAQSNKLIDDNYSYAVGIVSSLYGNRIVFRNNATGGYETETPLLLKDVNINGYSKLDPDSTIEYELMNNVNGSYAIRQTTDARYDEIYALIEPQIDETVYIAVKFTFKEDSITHTKEVITVQLPVIYSPSTSTGGDGYAWFNPYYNYFDRQFSEMSNNLTYTSFDIPLTYRVPSASSTTTYTFFIYRKTVDLDGNVSYTKMDIAQDQLFNLTITNGDVSTTIPCDYNTLIAYCENPLSVTNIVIQPYLVDKNDQDFVFLYIPITITNTDITYAVPYIDESGNIKYNSTTIYDNISISDISTYPYKSELNIPGIVRCSTDASINEEEFLDLNFYVRVYNILHPETTYVEGKTFILTSRLNQNINEINVKTFLGVSDASGIVSLKGINLLTGIKKLDLEELNLTSIVGSGAWINEITYISQITYLEELDLGNTSIYDRTAGTIFPNNDDNGLISRLCNLKNLKILNLSNNKIYLFQGLEALSSLTVVDVSNNTFTYNGMNIPVIGDLINAGITNAINSMYGSGGSLNQVTYSLMVVNGTSVENGTTTITLSDEMQTIIDELTSLEYQDKLESSCDISDIWTNSNLNDANIYNLPTSFHVYDSENSSDRNVDIHYFLKEISFNAVDNNQFQFVITYSYEYMTKTPGLIGNQWPTTYTFGEDIDFSLTYSVTRY